MGSLDQISAARKGLTYTAPSSGGGSLDQISSQRNPKPARPKPSKPQHHGGWLHTLARDSGADFVGNLSKDVGHAAVGVGPGLYKAGKAAEQNIRHPLRGQNLSLNPDPRKYHPGGKNASPFEKQIVEPTVQQYKQTYGPLVHGHVGEFAHTFGQHPLGPILDAATILDLGSTAAARAGLIDAGRADLVTRSPRAIATGKGPVVRDVSSTRSLTKAAQVGVNKVRSARPEGLAGGRVGGEVRAYGKAVQGQANKTAMTHLTAYSQYAKATKGLSEPEWAALHIRAMDIHPDDLKHIWQGTAAQKYVDNPKVRELVTSPSPKLVRAEKNARMLSQQGEALLKSRGKLSEETAAARPELTKQQASELLGRPVKDIHGDPYYLPHIPDGQTRNVSPLQNAGGGKGVPRTPGTAKQNQGILALGGKLHLRSDVLGPEFLRRVKYAKYDEIHNGLVRGAVRVTPNDLRERFGGKLPNGWEYIRAKATDRVPATLRAESDTHTPISQLIPNPDDLHDSALSDGFSTTDQGQAHVSGGRLYMIPKSTVKAATGEFTRSSDAVHTFIKRPLDVWRSLVLGLRPGFLTNNLVGNSLMYAVKTGGHGAIRDLFKAIVESHGAKVAKEALDDPATPAGLKQSLYEEFFPEQTQGTFARTQSPSVGKLEASKRAPGRVFDTATGAIPKLNQAVAETPFRQAAVRNFIRNSPEFKAAYKAMPKQTRSFQAAARQLLEGKGGAAYQRAISKQVDGALGNFRSLSPVERNVLRNAVPFYAWYRAIVTATGHLALDTPLRANILRQLGVIGKEWSDKNLGAVPSYLEGGIPYGKGPKGTKRALTTQGLNPWNTLEQLRQSGSDVTQLGVNPFLMGLYDAGQKYQQQHHKLSPVIALEALKGMAENLPVSRVAFPPGPSKLYPTRNRKTQIAGFMGVPVKDYDPNVAAQYKQQGR